MTNQEGNFVEHLIQIFSGGGEYIPCRQEAEFQVNQRLFNCYDNYEDLMHFEERYRDINV